MTSPTPRAAMQQALEALERALEWHRGDKWRSGIPAEAEAWRVQRESLESAIAALRASLSSLAAGEEPPELPPLSDDHRRLMKFYGVITLRALVNAQAHHIEKLQAKLPATPSLAPNRVREG